MAKTNGISDPNNLNVGQRVRMGTPNGWTIPDNPDVVTLEYWNKLSPFQQYIQHYSRNLYQPVPPATTADFKPSEWKYMGEAIAHNLAGASGNLDYRGLGPRAGQQAIYDKNGKLVMTAENKGTYDFISPNDDLLGHGVIDVRPWVRWGNSPQDKTTMQERQNVISGELNALDWAEYFNLIE